MDTYKVEYLPDPYELEDGNIANADVRIKCGNIECNCYPFVCYICKVCGEWWWSHCHRGHPPRGICYPCWRKERDLTWEELEYRELIGEIVYESGEWWEIFAKGIRPELYCYHLNEPNPFIVEIVKGCCQKILKKLRCDVPEVRDSKWAAYIQRKANKLYLYPPDKYSCCREDGTPRGSKHPSRRARQRRKKLWRKEPKAWDNEAILTELPQDWE